MTKNRGILTADALAIFNLEGLGLSEQEVQTLEELDKLSYSEEQIRAFLKAGMRGKNEKTSLSFWCIHNHH
jgi:hypothetical protein